MAAERDKKEKSMRQLLLGFITLGLLWTASAHAQMSPTGLYIVKVKEDACPTKDPKEKAAKIKEKVLKVSQKQRISPVFVYDYVVGGFAAELDEQEILALQADEDVEHVTADGLAYPTAIRSNPGALDRIDQRTFPLNQQYYYSSTAGSGVMVWLLDSGLGQRNGTAITYVAQLNGRVTHARNFAPRPGGLWTDIDPAATEDCIRISDGTVGHGNQVATIAGGTTHGVSPTVTFGIAKTLNCDGISSWAIFINAANWVRAQNLARPFPRMAVVNVSLAGDPNPDADQAVRDMALDGMLVVVGAGNAGLPDNNACSNSPARVGVNTAGVITVGASVATNDTIHPVSDTGACVEIFAPTDVLAQRADGTVHAFSGTSAATPVVSGVAAEFLRRQYNATLNVPSATYLEGLIMGKATMGAINTTGALPGTPDVLIYSRWTDYPEPEGY